MNYLTNVFLKQDINVNTRYTLFSLTH